MGKVRKAVDDYKDAIVTNIKNDQAETDKIAQRLLKKLEAPKSKSKPNKENRKGRGRRD